MLNYEMAPRPAIIFGCLLPAPWLGVVAGLMLAFAPAEGLPHRFSPLVLSLTHIVALGMLAPVMIGALFQLFPVVGGQAVRLSRFIAPFLALVCSAIAAFLSWGFYNHAPIAFKIAFCLAAPLLMAIVLAFIDAGMAMRLPPHRDATLTTLRGISLPLTSFAVFGLGLLVSLLAWGELDLLELLRLHVNWALVGWLGCLILGVATTVFPMFWQSPRPASWWHRVTPLPIWIALTALTLCRVEFIQTVITFGLMLFLAGLSGLALYYVFKAKRRFDPAWPLWVVCSSSGLMATILVLLSLWGDQKLPNVVLDNLAWWIGVLVLIGCGVGAVNAMLGKIIPFLVFLHLRRATPMGQRIPSMQMILPPVYLKWQARVFVLSLVCALLLPVSPSFVRTAAGVLFAFSQAFLAALLLKCLHQFRQQLLQSIKASPQS